MSSTWEDVVHLEGDTTIRAAKKEPEMLFNSYGQFIGETRRYLMITCTIGLLRQDAVLRDFIRIPKSLIKEVRVLEEGQKYEILMG